MSSIRLSSFCPAVVFFVEEACSLPVFVSVVVCLAGHLLTFMSLHLFKSLPCLSCLSSGWWAVGDIIVSWPGDGFLGFLVSFSFAGWVFENSLPPRVVLVVYTFSFFSTTQGTVRVRDLG